MSGSRNRAAHVQTRHRRHDLEQVVEPAQPLEQQGPPRPVDLGHPSYVRSVMALGQELRQRALRGDVALPRRHLLGPSQRGLQRPRRHQEPDAQRRQQRLGEGADVDHAAVAVEALQRLDGLVGPAVLAVVVVLDDHRVVLDRPAQERGPARHRQRDAGRELVGRRHVDQPRIVRESVDDQALGVHRYAVQCGAVALEEPVHRGVAGVLDGDDRAGLHQHPADQVHRLLGAGRDDHVVAGGDHRTGQPQVAGDLALEPPGAAAAVRRVGEPGAAELVGDQPAPHLEREEVGVRPSDPEVVQHAGPWRYRVGVVRARGPAAAPRPAGPGGSDPPRARRR